MTVFDHFEHRLFNDPGLMKEVMGSIGMTPLQTQWMKEGRVLAPKSSANRPYPTREQSQAHDRLLRSGVGWDVIENTVRDYFASKGMWLYPPVGQDAAGFTVDSHGQVVGSIPTPDELSSDFIAAASDSNPQHLYRDEAADARHKEISDELTEWWFKVSDGDLNAVLPKAVEYGSVDLKIMGAAMEGLSHRAKYTYPVGGVEMAIAFYLLGKISRLFGAYENGQNPSNDTWHDITVYSMMGRRVRQNGSWP